VVEEGDMEPHLSPLIDPASEMLEQAAKALEVATAKRLERRKKLASKKRQLQWIQVGFVGFILVYDVNFQ